MRSLMKIFFFVLTIIEGGIAIFLTLSTPSETQNTLLFGITANRLILVIIMAGIILASISFLLKEITPTSIFKSLSPRFNRFVLALRMILPFGNYMGIIVVFGIFFPERIPLVYHQLFERFLPFAIYISLIGLQTFIFFPISESKTSHVLGLLPIIVTFSILLVGVQFNFIKSNFGADYVHVDGMYRHLITINNALPAPYRYRILSEYILEAIIKLQYALPIDSIAPEQMMDWTKQIIYVYPFDVAAQNFRILQNVIIFALAYLYYHTQSKNRNLSLIGLLLLSITMMNVFYNSGLSFDTYTEVIFLLAAALVITMEWDIAIILLVFIAALNRESAIFIVLLYFISSFEKEIHPIKWLKSLNLKRKLVLIASAFSFALVYFGLRMILGIDAGYAGSQYGEVYPGLQLLWLNVTNLVVWVELLKTFNLLLIPLFLFKYWRHIYKLQFILFFVPWLLTVFVFGMPNETRLFLTPIALLFVPAFLGLLNRGLKKGSKEGFSLTAA